MTAAAQLIHHLRESVLCVDEHWAGTYEKGFAWWPHLQRQDILVVAEKAQPDGTLLEKAVVATEICTLNEPGMATHPDITALTHLTTLSGILIEGSKLRLHAHAWVDRSNLPLYQMVLGTVAGLQISEAAMLANMIEQEGLGEPAISGHPHSGMRTEPDEIASVLETLITPMGDEETPWPEDMLDDLRETYMDRPPCLMGNSDSSGLTAEFPFGDESSLLQVDMTQSHPVVGNGMMVLNSFNVEGLEDPLLDDPIGMNAWEAKHGDGPFLGSWNAQDAGSMSFVSFVPNALQNAAAASNFVLLAAARARRMAMKWMGDDWSQTWDAHGNCRAKTAIERMMARLSETP